MKENYFYSKEKLYNSIYILATGKDDIRTRLKEVFSEFHTLEIHHFPKKLQKEWQFIHNNLIKKGPVYWDGPWKGKLRTGSVKNTMISIKKKTGARIAKKIFDLYNKLNNF